MTPSEQKNQKRLQDDCVALDQGTLWLSASCYTARNGLPKGDARTRTQLWRTW